MRRLISILRKLLIGPTLDSLSHLSEGELQTIKNMARSDNQLFAFFSGAQGSSGSPTSGNNGPTAAADFNADFLQKKVTELSTIVVTLEERVEVLERLLVKKPL